MQALSRAQYMVNGYKIGSVLFMLNMFTIALLVVVSIVLRTLPRQNYRLLYVYNVFWQVGPYTLPIAAVVFV